MSNDPQDFEEFMKRREKASAAYVQGDAEGLSQIVAKVSPATIRMEHSRMKRFESSSKSFSEDLYSSFRSESTAFYLPKHESVIESGCDEIRGRVF